MTALMNIIINMKLQTVPGVLAQCQYFWYGQVRHTELEATLGYIASSKLV